MSETATTPASERPGAAPDAIRVENIRKRFGVVTALEDVSLRLGHGEVLGLIGDNGAGKSTLIKILTGFHRPDAGRIFVHGEEVQLKSVTHARSLGIDTVFQDLALVPGLSVYHNMFLNRELTHGLGPLRFLNNRAMRKRSREYLDDIGVRIPSMDAEVARMSGGQRQAIAIARSTHSNAKIILLDEPLAAMGAREGALIIELITELKQRGDVSIIVIAHNYVHVFEMCDRVNLLRNGRIMLDKPTDETSVEELTAIVAAEYRVPRAPSARDRHCRAHGRPELVRELRIRAEALVEALRQRPEAGRACRELLAHAASTSSVKASERSRKSRAAARVHHRVVRGQQQVGLERAETADRRPVGVEVVDPRRDQQCPVACVDAALEHRVDHDRRPAARIPDPEVPERVAGQVQDLDAPAVAEPDRLAAAQPRVDRRVASARALSSARPASSGSSKPYASCHR